MHIVELFFVIDVKMRGDRGREGLDILRFFGKLQRLAKAGTAVADDVAIHIDATDPCVFVHIAVRPDRGQNGFAFQRRIELQQGFLPEIPVVDVRKRRTMQPVGLVQLCREAAGGTADMTRVGLHPEFCQTGRTFIKDTVQPERRRFAAVAHVGEKLVLIVQDCAFQHRLHFLQAHGRNGVCLQQFFGTHQDATRTETRFTPFREAFISTVLRDHIDGNRELFDQIGSTVGDLQRVTKAGQASFRKQHDEIAGFLGAHDAEDGLDVRTKHFLGNDVHLL